MRWKKFKTTLRYLRAPLEKQYRLIIKELKKQNYFVTNNRKLKNVYIHNTIYFILMLITIINNDYHEARDLRPQKLLKKYDSKKMHNVIMTTIIYYDVNIHGEISHPYLKEILSSKKCHEVIFSYSNNAEINKILEVNAKLVEFYYDTIVSLISCDIDDKKKVLKSSILAFLQFNTINQRTKKIKLINKYDDITKYEQNVKLIELQVSYMKMFTKSLQSLLGRSFSYLIDFINYKSRKLY